MIQGCADRTADARFDLQVLSSIFVVGPGSEDKLNSSNILKGAYSTFAQGSRRA